LSKGVNIFSDDVVQEWKKVCDLHFSYRIRYFYLKKLKR